MQPMDEKSIPRRISEIHSQTIDGKEVLMVPLEGSVRVLNAVGTRIWSLIDGRRNAGEIAEVIAHDFDVDIATARADTVAFLRELQDARALAGD